MSDTDLKSNTFNHVRLLEHHLFPLVNPAQYNNWFFVSFTWPIADPFHGKSLAICTSKSFQSWSDELTQFNGDEFLTIMGCLFISFFTSTSRLLFHAGSLRSSPSLSVNDAINFKASQLPGNSFEITAAVCVVDANHLSRFENSGPTFKGQNGLSFVQNIIVNMNLRHGLFNNAPVTVECHPR